jgi:oxalate decarboxylase/phosphoglucose isomerase-like protein (cupin superfamily)
MQKLDEHIKLQKPVIIKNYFDADSCDNIVGKNAKKKCDYANCYYIDKSENSCTSDLLQNLESNENYVVENMIRVWNHKKGNLTKYHYDGNGVNVINICLSGKKKFTLTPPNSHFTIPFSNVSIFNCSNDEQIFILEKGDIFLVPPFWYHEVETLEDNTVTINYNFVKKDMIIDQQNLLKYKLHSLFRTHMTTEPIMEVAKNRKLNLTTVPYNYARESLYFWHFCSFCSYSETK